MLTLRHTCFYAHLRTTLSLITFARLPVVKGHVGGNVQENGFVKKNVDDNDAAV